MKYKNVVIGEFISRPNRFIAHVLVGGKDTVCHVMNTGRMKELLVPGATVYLQKASNPERKTQYDLIAVQHHGSVVNIDSMAPNKVALEYIPRLFDGVTYVRPETVYGNSRFDFYIETEKEKIWLEIKGVTLRNGNRALFPDAPTERGTKHLRELAEAKRNGFRAAVLFVIAMEGIESFSPNAETDPAFAAALSDAEKAGVEIYAVSCNVSPDELLPADAVKVIL